MADMAEEKTETVFTSTSVQRRLQARFNPLRNLTPELLSLQLDEFASGRFQRSAVTFDTIEARDDVLQTVARKRKKAAARRGYEILTVEDNPEADRHKEALQYFYNHLTATDAMDENLRGGFKTLSRQMLDAIGKKYAVHEIVWEPQADGNITATFRFAPLWFFENRTGQLRFLKEQGATEGEEMPDGEWMVTIDDGPGLMLACSAAFMFKKLPTLDWLTYSERHGMPGMLGKTDAQLDSPEWKALEEAVKTFGAEWAAVVNRTAEIDSVDTTTRGQLPYPPLIERMDRAMTMLWRGGDLGTMSKDKGQGASLQGDESDILQDDDADLIEETLNTQVGRFVIRYSFGDGVEPLAYLHVKRDESVDEKRELEKWKTGVDLGVPLAIKDFRETFGLPQPGDGEDLLTIQSGRTALPIPVSDASNVQVANQIEGVDRNFKEKVLENLGRAQAKDLQPFFDRLTTALEIENESEFRAALANLRSDLPKILSQSMNDPATARAIENSIGTILVDSAAEARRDLSAHDAANESYFRSMIDKIKLMFLN